MEKDHQELRIINEKESQPGTCTDYFREPWKKRKHVSKDKEIRMVQDF